MEDGYSRHAKLNLFNCSKSMEDREMGAERTDSFIPCKLVVSYLTLFLVGEWNLGIGPLFLKIIL